MWHLTHGLVARGIEVIVVCEMVIGSPDPNIRLIRVNGEKDRPRWKSMLAFRKEVSGTICREFKGCKMIIHSHERSINHQITTFHGPPIEAGNPGLLVSLLSPRIRAWKRMEQDELLGPSVRMTLAVSSQLLSTLIKQYPALAEKKNAVAWPGVFREAGSTDCRNPRADITRFLFVGQEWKRKGLTTAVELVGEYRRLKGNASLQIYGVDEVNLPKSFRGIDWLDVKGWVDSVPYSDFDILLHPAKSEPFGMVVAEARKHGIPVLMSANVGAADLGFEKTHAVKLGSSIQAWVDAATDLLKSERRLSEVKWTWDDLVDFHIREVYGEVVATEL